MKFYVLPGFQLWAFDDRPDSRSVNVHRAITPPQVFFSLDEAIAEFDRLPLVIRGYDGSYKWQLETIPENPIEVWVARQTGGEPISGSRWTIGHRIYGVEARTINEALGVLRTLKAIA